MSTEERMPLMLEIAMPGYEATEIIVDGGTKDVNLGRVYLSDVVRLEENMDALEVGYKPNRHWSLSAGWMYMFERKGTKYPSWSNSKVNPSSTERYIKNNANMVVLSVSYSADFGSLFRSGKRSLYNSDGGSSLLKM